MSKPYDSSGSHGSPDLSGTATHTLWQKFYESLTKCREDCLAYGRAVQGNNPLLAIRSLSEYHSGLYTFAQQVFSFYDPSVGDQLTEEWVTLGEKVSEFLEFIRDPDFYSQLIMESNPIEKELRISLLKYFNKVDRLAGEAGLLVGRENKALDEPKRGLLGASRRS